MTEDMGDFILPLTGDSLTIEEVGGKAINLAKMFDVGFNVPPAFAISADVYNRFLDKKGLKTRIAEVLSEIDFDDEARPFPWAARADKWIGDRILGDGVNELIE